MVTYHGVKMFDIQQGNYVLKGSIKSDLTLCAKPIQVCVTLL